MSLQTLYLPQSLSIICCKSMKLADHYSTLFLFYNSNDLRNDFSSTQNFTCRRQIKTLEFRENLGRKEQGGDNCHHFAGVNYFICLREIFMINETTEVMQETHKG